MKTDTTLETPLCKSMGEMIASLQKTKDSEPVQMTVGDLRKILMGCMTTERRSYTEAACQVEQYIIGWQMRKPT